MRPLLGTADDVAALWEHINDTIDGIATDHAPHTLAEKASASPPPGVPGLETSLPLMLTAVSQDRLTLDCLIDLMHHNPRRIFNLPQQPHTRVEVDMTPHTIRSAQMKSKCAWTPFDGMEAAGKVTRVVLRGEVVFEDGRILAQASDGRVL